MAGCGGNGDDTAPQPDAAGGGGGGGTPDAGQQPSCNPQNDTCGGETICIGSSCEPAFGRTYRVSIASLAVAAQNGDAEAWDAFGGAPDPYVVVFLNGTNVLQTAEAQDTFSPTYPDAVDLIIPAGARVTVEVWDGDVSDDDWIFGCVADPLTADFLRGWGFECNQAGSSIAISLDRK